MGDMCGKMKTEQGEFPHITREVGKMEYRQDELDELQTIKDEMKGMLQMAKELLGGSPNWMASVEMALDHDHNWVGGSYDRTFQDEIDEAVMGQEEYDRIKSGRS
jgi:hypothetical protein